MAKLDLLDFQDLDIPSSWIPAIKAFIRWYNNQPYPVMSMQNKRDTPRQLVNNLQYSFIPLCRDMWALQDQATKDSWTDAASFIQRSGYQLFVKDLCFRIKNGYPGVGTPSPFYTMFGLKMSNPGGATNVSAKVGALALRGQTTISFNYKKQENAPTGGDPFKFTAVLTYMEAGENKTETHTWEAPAGDVGWTSVSETFGTSGRRYSNIEVTWALNAYDADVWLANIVISDETAGWTVNYTGVTLPELSSPPWAKTGSLGTIYNDGGLLFLADEAGAGKAVKWTRTPDFMNERGSTVKVRLKIPEGSSKDEGPAKYSFFYTHSDGTYEVNMYFYRNGFKLCFDGKEFSKHQDMSEFKLIRSSILRDTVTVFMGREIVFRKTLTGSGGQEVSFGAQSPDNDNLDAQIGYLKYFHGSNAEPELDVFREDFFVKAGKTWVPDIATRIEGWTFTPQYIAPYFTVLYLG